MIKYTTVFIILFVSITSFKLRFNCSFDYDSDNLNVQLSFKEFNFLSNHQPKFVFETTVYDLDNIIDNETGIKYMRAILEPKGMSNISFQFKDANNNLEFISVKAPGYNLRYYQNYYVYTYIYHKDGLTKNGVTKEMIVNGVQNPKYESFLDLTVGNIKRKVKCVITDGDVSQNDDVYINENNNNQLNDKQNEINNALNQGIKDKMTNKNMLVL